GLCSASSCARNGRAGRGCSGCRTRSLSRARWLDPAGERPARVFDIIGKRNWFFALSLLVTIPGLFFIILTPATGGKEGLDFSIDYTGGTHWVVTFQDPNVSADQVRTVLDQQGLVGS